MKKAKILIVEDDPDVIVAVEDQLEYLEHQVITAHNGKEGLEKVEENRPDLIVLDVMMPEMDGYEVCERLKSAPETQDIPILMLTARGQVQDKVRSHDLGADEYLSKPYNKAEFKAIIAKLLKKSNSSPYTDTTSNNSVFSISLKPEQRLNIRVNGEINFNDMSDGVLHLDPDVYARHAKNAYLLNDWRFQAKQVGKDLYQKIFRNHPKAHGTYYQVLGAIKTEDELHICFETERDCLRLPLEFLFADREYLVLQYPLTRSISGVRIRKRTLSPAFFNELWSKNEALKILLIASNTTPSIPGVEQEIASLQASVKDVFEDKGVPIRLKTIPTQEATYKAVRKELKNCKYHIVHYAGHGNYDQDSPEQSHLLFWEEPNREGDVIEIPISELKILFRNSEVRFIYLSCCLGTATSEPAKLLDDDFLGIADGLVHAGVPAVLGFRWPVSDRGAKTLAHEFYKSLAEQGQIDSSLLNARREVAMQDRDDMTWISPILIMQG